MSWKVADITKTFDVYGSDGETATITIRRMSEGDSMRMQQLSSEDIAAGKSISDVLVALRRFRVATFVTAWTLPFDVTPESVLDLAPEVADVIDEQVQLFNPGVFPRAQTADVKAKQAEALAGVVEAFLDEEDESVTTDDLTAAVEAYRGEDVARPTESA